MARDRDERASHEVAHFGAAPQGEDEDGRGDAVQVDPRDAREPEVGDEQEDELGHDAHELEVELHEPAQGTPARAHAEADEHAEHQRQHDGQRGDADGDAQTLEDAHEVAALEDDVNSQIRHGAPSFR